VSGALANVENKYAATQPVEIRDAYAVPPQVLPPGMPQPATVKPSDMIAQPLPTMSEEAVTIPCVGATATPAPTPIVSQEIVQAPAAAGAAVTQYPPSTLQQPLQASKAAGKGRLKAKFRRLLQRAHLQRPQGSQYAGQGIASQSHP
jgi:hypothetical protein